MTIVDPATTYHRARGRSRAGRGHPPGLPPARRRRASRATARSGPNSYIVDSQIGAGSRVWFSVLEGATRWRARVDRPVQPPAAGRDRSKTRSPSATTPRSKASRIGVGHADAPLQLRRRRGHRRSGSTSPRARSPSTSAPKHAAKSRTVVGDDAVDRQRHDARRAGDDRRRRHDRRRRGRHPRRPERRGLARRASAAAIAAAARPIPADQPQPVDRRRERLSASSFSPSRCWSCSWPPRLRRRWSISTGRACDRCSTRARRAPARSCACSTSRPAACRRSCSSTRSRCAPARPRRSGSTSTCGSSSAPWLAVVLGVLELLVLLLAQFLGRVLALARPEQVALTFVRPVEVAESGALRGACAR